MIKNKPLHFLSFDDSRPTSQDLYANDVVLNTRLIDRPTDYDPYAQKVAFNMRCDGEAGSFYHLDDCGNTATNRTSGAVISSTNTRDGRPVIDFSSSYIAFPHHVDYQFDSEDFTIELWMMFNTIASAYQSFLTLRTGTGYAPWTLSLSNTNKIGVWLGNPTLTAWTIFLSNFTPTINDWFHLALVRSGTTLTFYVNGASQGSTTFTDPITYSASHGLTIGGLTNVTEVFYGSMQDIRITKGVARYTGTFTPPSSIPVVRPIRYPDSDR